MVFKIQNNILVNITKIITISPLIIFSKLYFKSINNTNSSNTIELINYYQYNLSMDQFEVI